MRVPGLRFDLDPDALPWSPTGVEGVALIALHPTGAELEAARALHGSAVDAAVLIRMEPGVGYPAHRHLGGEDVLVLLGGYRDERGTWPAGSFVRYEAGSVHSPVALGQPGRAAGPDHPPCVLFATARGGIELVREG